ncbi:MAG: hypothetical protein AB3X44_16130 [Leptothrix sp. (in: b-proteobacteria)]
MSKKISDLRDILFAALDQVKDGSMDLDKAKTVNEISKTIIDTAKVEVDYMRTVGGGKGKFIELEEPEAQKLPKGITGIRQHRLEG